MRCDAFSVTSRLLLVGALLGATASGCASRLLHRGGPAVMAVPASGGAPARKSGRKHDDRHAAPAFAGDPLGEARARAEQSPG
jgi:hypothetical protein